MESALRHAASIQTPIVDRPWRVVNCHGFVVSHCKSWKAAEAIVNALSHTYEGGLHVEVSS